MRYLCLLYDDEAGMADATQEQMAEEMKVWGAFDEEVTRAGVKLGGEALRPTSSATSVSRRGEELVTTDGPYAETKEQLGGYYLIEAKDLDEAIEWAAKIPTTRSGGTVEIRPIYEMADMMKEAGMG